MGIALTQNNLDQAYRLLMNVSDRISLSTNTNWLLWNVTVAEVEALLRTTYSSYEHQT